jgi:predicted MFS family arabinose efflux permease
VEAIGSVAKTAVAGGTPAVVGGVDRIVLTAAGPDDLVRMGTPQGRWVLTATILASGMAFLDGTVVNVALRAIGNDLDADLGDLQWVVSAYMLTLASLILVAGSLGDIVGRRRVFLVGVIWFAVASVLCGLAPNPLTLIVARALQGVGGALLTPGSLAILQSGFRPEDRARAIGAWSGLAGVSTAIGPFLGGWLVIEASWRWIFWINVPLAAVVVLVTLRHVPTSCNSTMGTRAPAGHRRSAAGQPRAGRTHLRADRGRHWSGPRGGGGRMRGSAALVPSWCPSAARPTRGAAAPVRSAPSPLRTH